MKSFFTFFVMLVTVALIGAVVYFVGYSKQDIETVFEQKIMSTVQAVQPSVVSITATDAQGSVQMASGVIVTPSGGLITSGHIVSQGSRYAARLSHGDNVEIVLVPSDGERDIAYFRIQSPDRGEYPFVQLISSQALLRIGHQILVFSATNAEATVISGMVSGLGTSINSVTGRQLTGLMKLDAAIEPGMSGGPTVLLNGEVVGITTAYAGGNSGHGWATPVTSEDLKVFDR